MSNQQSKKGGRQNRSAGRVRNNRARGEEESSELTTSSVARATAAATVAATAAATTAAAVTMGVAGDEYETMPLDIKFMLCNFCNKESDVIWDPFYASAVATGGETGKKSGKKSSSNKKRKSSETGKGAAGGSAECYGSADGFSTRYMAHLGYQVYTPPRGENVDFFSYRAPPRGVTCIVSNVPFSRKQEILQRLVEFRLPFCVLLPSDVVQRDYFSEIVRQTVQDERRWTVLLANKTLRFHRNGVVQPLARFKSAFFIFRTEEEEGEEEMDGEKGCGEDEGGASSSEGAEAGGKEGEEEEEGEEGEEDECNALLAEDDVLMNVTVKMFDYEKILQRGYTACNEIHTNGPMIGKPKR